MRRPACGFALLALLVVVAAGSGAMGRDGATPFSDCLVCHATVHELRKRTKASTSPEVDVEVAYGTICVQDNFRTYSHIPPRMVRGCRKIIAAFEETDRVAAALAARGPSEADVRAGVCMELTSLCDAPLELAPNAAGGLASAEELAVEAEAMRESREAKPRRKDGKGKGRRKAKARQKTEL